MNEIKKLAAEPGNGIVAIVGAGGKTTLLWRLCHEARLLGKKVIVTTTTHMAEESGRPYVPAWQEDTLDLVQQALSRYGYVLTAEYDEKIGKYSAIGEGEELEKRILALSSLCDLLLIEADGARRLPFKAPGEKEPVIPSCADTVVAVLGLSALGKKIEDIAFRPEQTAALLGKRQDEILLPEDYFKAAFSLEGLRKNTEKKRFLVIFNQSDVLKNDRLGEQFRTQFADPGLVNERNPKFIVSTSVSERELQETDPQQTECHVTSLNPGGLGIVLLAAGSSRRFGRNKLLTEIQGKTMFRRTLEHFLDAEIGLPDVVTQYPEIEECTFSLGLRVFRNPHPEQGISGSMQLGLHQNLERPCCLFSVCDQPWLKPETIQDFVLAYLNQEKPAACLSFQGKPGNPCIFSKKYYPELLELKGDTGGKTVLKRHPDEVFFYEVTDRQELTDIDTPECMEALRNTESDRQAVTNADFTRREGG